MYIFGVVYRIEIMSKFHCVYDSNICKDYAPNIFYVTASLVLFTYVTFKRVDPFQRQSQ